MSYGYAVSKAWRDQARLDGAFVLQELFARQPAGTRLPMEVVEAIAFKALVPCGPLVEARRGLKMEATVTVELGPHDSVGWRWEDGRVPAMPAEGERIVLPPDHAVFHIPANTEQGVDVKDAEAWLAEQLEDGAHGVQYLKGEWEAFGDSLAPLLIARLRLGVVLLASPNDNDYADEIGYRWVLPSTPSKVLPA